ncbi:hypothetical protein XA68_15220 [Ophiocordyceps unilateralis]|uniref:Enterotoxin n=1 Tax=Ophiocordyceps unilateralis TaxID=268505 RepID=A0A2A9P8U6_OPHUN|nr:hypothetical protein XA68_15220 [Ophiocordyceps unilateralis]
MAYLVLFLSLCSLLFTECHGQTTTTTPAPASERPQGDNIYYAAGNWAPEQAQRFGIVGPNTANPPGFALVHYQGRNRRPIAAHQRAFDELLRYTASFQRYPNNDVAPAFIYAIRAFPDNVLETSEPGVFIHKPGNWHSSEIIWAAQLPPDATLTAIFKDHTTAEREFQRILDNLTWQRLRWPVEVCMQPRRVQLTAALFNEVRRRVNGSHQSLPPLLPGVTRVVCGPNVTGDCNARVQQAVSRVDLTAQQQGQSSLQPAPASDILYHLVHELGLANWTYADDEAMDTGSAPVDSQMPSPITIDSGESQDEQTETQVYSPISISSGSSQGQQEESQIQSPASPDSGVPASPDSPKPASPLDMSMDHQAESQIPSPGSQDSGVPASPDSPRPASLSVDHHVAGQGSPVRAGQRSPLQAGSPELNDPLDPFNSLSPPQSPPDLLNLSPFNPQSPSNNTQPGFHFCPQFTLDQLMNDLADRMEVDEGTCAAASNINETCESTSPGESVSRFWLQNEMTSNDGGGRNSERVASLLDREEELRDNAMCLIFGTVALASLNRDNQPRKRETAALTAGQQRIKCCQQFSSWTEQICAEAANKSPKPTTISSSAATVHAQSSASPEATECKHLDMLRVSFTVADKFWAGSINPVFVRVNGKEFLSVTGPERGKRYHEVWGKFKLRRFGLADMANIHLFEIVNEAEFGGGMTLKSATIRARCDNSDVWKEVHTDLNKDVEAGGIWKAHLTPESWKECDGPKGFGFSSPASALTKCHG